MAHYDRNLVTVSSLKNKEKRQRPHNGQDHAKIDREALCPHEQEIVGYDVV
jgi:hypothetical protein